MPQNKMKRNFSDINFLLVAISVYAFLNKHTVNGLTRRVKICRRHERVEKAPGHGGAAGEGEGLVQLDVVDVQLVVVQVPEVENDERMTTLFAYF